LQSKDRKYIKVTGKNGKHHIGIERQASRSARNQQSDDSGRGRRNNGTRNIGNGDVGTDSDTKVNMQSDVTSLVRSTILDMFVPKQDNVTPDAAVTTDPEKVRLDAFRAQMDRLGIGK
jgi:autotransporter adhesin